MGSSPSQLLEPFKIGATHSSFAIHVGAEKCGAKRLELFHHLVCSNAQCFSPSLDYDLALGRVQRHDNRRAAHSLAELPEKWRVDFAVLEGGTSDDDLVRPPMGNFLRAANGANSAAHPHIHSKALGGFAAKFAREFAVIAFSHGSVQVNYMEPFVFFEFQQQGHHIRDRKLAFSPVHELHCLALLQVDAWNQHGSLTGIPLAARNSFSSRMG